MTCTKDTGGNNGKQLMESLYSQVVFNDVPHSYQRNSSITCSYTVTTAVQPDPKDWVGIFKVGWSTTQNYYTFVWVDTSSNDEGLAPSMKQVVFSDYYLPKDDGDFYQFCYIDNKGQVRGASTPFCFQSPAELSVDSSLENDLLVITTQKQADELEKEKEELLRDLEEHKEANASLKRELGDRVEDVQRLQESNEKLLQAIGKLEQRQAHEKVAHVTEQAGSEQWTGTSMDKSRREQESLSAIQEKYEKALLKIAQLKQDRRKLRKEVEAQEEQITRLKESEKAMHRLQDVLQLLQVDLQTLEKEKQKQTEEMQKMSAASSGVERLTEENQTLRRRLSEQDAEDGDMVAQCWALQTQLEQEKKRGNEACALAQRELQEARLLLEEAAVPAREKGWTISQLEKALTESRMANMEHINAVEVAKVEKDKLTQDNQNLKRDIQRLQVELNSLQAACQVGSLSDPYNSPLGPPAGQQQQVTGSGTNPEEEFLVCQFCHEVFPGISPKELEQHEQSHKVCPYCTLLCDCMDQDAFVHHVYAHEA